MGFTKLDSGIVNSSIWSEPVATRVLWITILAMSDETGFVSTSVPGLLRSANISKEDFDAGITALESPDKYSRTTSFDGRRIEKVEGGWIILNYPKYREREDKDSHREYMRKWREKRNCEPCELTVNNSDCGELTVESPSASASVSASSSGIKKKFIAPTIEEVQKYCDESGRKIDVLLFHAHHTTRNWVPKGCKNQMSNWKSAVVTWEKYNPQFAQQQLNFKQTFSHTKAVPGYAAQP